MNEIIKKRAIETGIRSVPRLKDLIIMEFGREAMRAASSAGLAEELAAGISSSLKNLLKREDMNGADELAELNDARKHLWTKIEESRAEAELLDRVYEFLARRPAGAN
jgi:hypothetical protein